MLKVCFWEWSKVLPLYIYRGIGSFTSQILLCLALLHLKIWTHKSGLMQFIHFIHCLILVKAHVELSKYEIMTHSVIYRDYSHLQLLLIPPSPMIWVRNMGYQKILPILGWVPPVFFLTCPWSLVKLRRRLEAAGYRVCHRGERISQSLIVSRSQRASCIPRVHRAKVPL